MPAPPKLAVATLILMALLLAGCDSTTAFGQSDPSDCDYDYGRLMEASWSVYSQTWLPAGKDGELDAFQCVVLHRVEFPQVTPGGEFTHDIAPVFGSVFRQDRNRSRDIHEYALKLPNDMYLGERDVSARVADGALSGANKPQLIIEDRDAGGTVVEASIWEWQEKTRSEDSAYKSRGWFFGDAGVTVDNDQVTVLNRWRKSPRSEIAQRMVYVPHDKKSYYLKEGTSRIVDSATVDLVPLVMPDDANLPMAEYPEKLVLALYQRLPLTDTARLAVLMSSDLQTAFEAHNTKAFGCLADPRLTRVYVQDLNIDGSQGIPAHIENKDKTVTDKITVKSLCILNDGGKEIKQAIFVTWSVRWDWKVDSRTGTWQIVGAIDK
jgi:hypothetical protein